MSFMVNSFSVAPSGPSTSTITLRSTSLAQSSGSSTTTITLPTGAAAGDCCIILAASGDSYFTPSGWTSLQSNVPATGWNAQTFRKMLTSADITAGSVTFTKNPAGGGLFQGFLVAYCINGGASVRALKLASSTTGTSINGTAFSFPSTLGQGDVVLMIATGRGNSATIAISPSTFDQRNNQSSGSVGSYNYTMPSSGAGSFTPSNISSSHEFVFMAVALCDPVPPIFSVASSMTSPSGFWADGDTITGIPGTHDGESSLDTYKWTKDGVDISGATSLTYTLPVGFSTHDLAFVTVGHNDGATTNSSSTSHTIGTPAFVTQSITLGDGSSITLADSSDIEIAVRTA